MKKWVIILSAIPVVLIVVLLVGMLAIRSIVTKELLVEQMEATMNLRAEVRELDISLLSAVSSIELRGVKLAPRDRLADAATPLSERPPLKAALISAEAFELKFRLGPLLQKRFELQRLILDRPQVNLVLLENGGNNLSALFAPPKVVGGKPREVAPATKAAAEEAKKPAAKKEPDAPAKPFTARDLPIAAKLDAVGMDNANINVRVQKTGQLIRISGLTTRIDNIDIDPADLARHNGADVRFDMNLAVIGRDGKEAGAFALRSGGRVTPFEAVSGRVNTAVTYALTLKRGSYVDGMPLLQQLAGAFPMLEKAGVRLEGATKRAELQADASLRVAYGGGRVAFLDDVVFKTKHYDLALRAKSWIQTTNDQHLFSGQLLATPDESARCIQSVDARLEKALAKSKGVDKAEVRKQVLGPILKGDRIMLPFTSSGSIKSPSVALGVELPSLTDLLKGQLSGLAKSKLDEALKKNPKAKELMKKLPKLPF